MKYYIILLVVLLFIYSFHITKEHFEITKFTKPFTEAIRDLSSAAGSVNEIVNIYVPNVTWGYNFYDKFNDTIRAVRGLPPMKPVSPNINYTVNDNIKRYTIGYSGFSI
jgi:hypothetical protein